MNLSTWICVIVIVPLLVYACHHVYRNFVDGRHDCCGCDACKGHHARKAAASEQERACPYCSGHK